MLQEIVALAHAYERETTLRVHWVKCSPAMFGLLCKTLCITGQPDWFAVNDICFEIDFDLESFEFTLSDDHLNERQPRGRA